MHLCHHPAIAKRHHIDLAAIGPETADSIAGAMEGLATGSRVQLLCRLVAGPRSVKQLTAETGMEQPAVSQQLRVLRDLGFVRADKQGRTKIYTLRDSHIARLLQQAAAHAEHLRARPLLPAHAGHADPAVSETRPSAGQDEALA